MKRYHVLWISLAALVWMLACGNSSQTTTPSDSPSETQTRAPLSTETPAPAETAVPAATATQPPAQTELPIESSFSAKATILQGANLRAGPSTDYDKIGGLSAGDACEIVCQTPDGEWYQVALESGELAWIAAFLVNTEVEAIPTVAALQLPSLPTLAPPTQAPATGTPVPAAPTAAPEPPPAVCSCSGNVYNCSDFSTRAQAQSCYNYCRSQGRGDVHKLDRDNDGDACESLP